MSRYLHSLYYDIVYKTLLHALPVNGNLVLLWSNDAGIQVVWLWQDSHVVVRNLICCDWDCSLKNNCCMTAKATLLSSSIVDSVMACSAIICYWSMGSPFINEMVGKFCRSPTCSGSSMTGSTICRNIQTGMARSYCILKFCKWQSTHLEDIPL